MKSKYQLAYESAKNNLPMTTEMWDDLKECVRMAEAFDRALDFIIELDSNISSERGGQPLNKEQWERWLMKDET